MKQKSFWLRMGMLFAVMVLMVVVVLAGKRGQSLEERPPMLGVLAPGEAAAAVNATHRDTYLMYDSTAPYDTPHMETVRGMLDVMRIPYTTVDLAQGSPALPAPDSMILFCSQSLSPFADRLEEFSAWLRAGGQFGITITPVLDPTLQLFYRTLGILESANDYVQFSAYQYTIGELPLWEGAAMEGHDDFALPVRLSEDSVVHLSTADERQIPLMWEKPVGDGRVVVTNMSLIEGKDSRSIAALALFALSDEVIYPIINAGMVYVDDFPAPQPEGFNERLLKETGYSIQGTFRSVWWPDMKQLARDYGFRYTGILIETYNDQVEPPFEPEPVDRSLMRYYASEMLDLGGEVGLHGYNHMPLNGPGFVYPWEDYKTWATPAYMGMALKELERFAEETLPLVKFVTYVPPSNYLGEMGWKAITDTLPDIRVISGLYLPETGMQALVQEFEEHEDGIVSVPRISAGYAPDPYMQRMIASGLLLHGVFSHFVHPDDILDDVRRAGLAWEEMRAGFAALGEDLRETYPQLRHATSQEGAAAVQRYARLGIAREDTEDGMLLKLSGFVDEAWLAIHGRSAPEVLEGGEVFPVGSGLYWIRADQDTLRIRWAEGT